MSSRIKCIQYSLAVRIDAGNDEKDARSLGATLHQATKAEDDGALIFLHHLKKQQKMYIDNTISMNALP